MAMDPPQPSVSWVKGKRQLEHETGHSPTPSAEVKKEWSCSSTTPFRLHGSHGNNH